jgi:FAD-dependent fumarate reductase
LTSLLLGLCAAYELGKQGCQVLVLEKQEEFGGNGKEALTGINLIGSSSQDARGITDSITQFKKDIYYAGTLPPIHPFFLMPLGSNQNDPTLVELLATKSKEFVTNLLKELDITLTDLVNCGGHSVARTHKPANWPTGDSQSVGRLLVNQVFSSLSPPHF